MNTKFYFIIITATISLNAFSQQNSPSIIAAGGGVASVNNLSLEWTLGEVATESIKSPTSLYTEGYHQPVLMVVKNISVPELVSSRKINVFPNPATSTINILLGFTPETNLSVSLMDMHERILLKKQIPSNNRSLQLNVNRFAKGTYLLIISNANGSIFQSYKIIKA